MKSRLVIFFGIIILIGGVSPVFAEVTQFQLDQNIYQKGDFIEVTGKVTEDSSGLVTVVIRDPNNEFVLLNQAIIRADNTFEKTILINEKFDLWGVHNTTAFVTNVTAAQIQSFELSPTIPEKTIHQKEMPIIEIDEHVPSKTTSTLNETFLDTDISSIDEIIQEKSKEPPEVISNQIDVIADFVDVSKDPQYYLDRYYNEPKYKSWFDRNYPDITIEEAIGYVPPIIENKKTDEFVNEFLPQAEATSIQVPQNNNNDNSEIAQIGLALGGMIILFGAVYGIKRKVDEKSKRITINKNIIRKKILSSIIQPKPKEIIQRRLAIGEITLEEYEQLCKKLDYETK